MTKIKISAILFLMGFIMIGILIGYLGTIMLSAASLSKMELGEYQIFVDSKVIDFLNEKYTSKQENLFCIDGTINDDSKVVYINKIRQENILSATEMQVTSVDRYACSNNLGDIHTHPKIFGLFPACEFSIPDAYNLGEGFGKNNNRVAGVYCAKDKIAFYISNNEIDDSIIIKNKKIGYTKIFE